MKSTVRAVADELASAAELTLGKRSGRPVALVRGAAFTRGEGSIRDVAHARGVRPLPRDAADPVGAGTLRAPPLQRSARVKFGLQVSSFT